MTIEEILDNNQYAIDSGKLDKEKALKTAERIIAMGDCGGINCGSDDCPSASYFSGALCAMSNKKEGIRMIPSMKAFVKRFGGE